MSFSIHYKKGSLALILTTFNHELFIEDALNGILHQYRVPDQVIICDDASSDKTPEIIESFISSLRLEWIFVRHNLNLGITLNLLSALRLVHSEVIVALAGDDISLPNRCLLSERMFHENPTCLAILLSGHSIDSGGTFRSPVMADADPISFFNFNIIKLGFPSVLPVGLAYRAEVFTDFDIIAPSIKNEDDYLTVKALCFGGIANSHEISFYYRVHNSSASSWIRNISSTGFYEMLHEDFLNRIAHFSNWISLISKSTIISPKYKALYSQALYRKIELYKYIHCRRSLNIFVDLSMAVRNFKILCIRELVQLLFGLKTYIIFRIIKDKISSRFGSL